MTQSLIRKTWLIAALTLASAFVITLFPLQLGLDLRGGSSLILRVKTDDIPAARQREVVDETRQTLVRRINAYGLSEAPVQPYGSRGNELLVQLPGVRDPGRIRDLLETRAVLEWYSVEEGPYASSGDAMVAHSGILPLNRKLFGTLPATDSRQEWYVVNSTPVVRGTDLRDARATAGSEGQPVTTFSLSSEAGKRFQQFTSTHIGHLSAVVLDGKILSAPVIQNVIGDSGQIRGARTLAEAQDLAINLRSGALPAAVEIIQERTVEASLGADSIRQGMQAAAVGLAAVVAAMVAYYRWAGANATLALALNGALLIAALMCCGAVLTLPGIAGAVLTIGMAVDSNVLIFERIREELRVGKSNAAALAAGFSKAFATLIDTHVTTVVSCAFLFFFGTPAVKGFAATLVLGLVTNLFTSVFVSRVAFDWELTRGNGLAPLSIGMTRAEGHP